jgi:magnesium transporter
LDEDEDLFAPATRAARRRTLWLGINLLTAFLASWVIGRFESTLEHIVALAVLMPIVASMGGVAGTQVLTLMVRGLALGEVGLGNLRALIAKEVTVGLLNGLVWATVVGIIAGLWFQDPKLGLVIALAMLLNLVNAALAGVLVPLTLRRMNIDPALAGGVVLTTFTDVIGFLSFLGLGTLILLK